MEKQLTILIVDDMEINRVSLKEIFKNEYQILEAEDGQTALEIMAAEKVNLVILDLFMPVMNGFEVLKKMKQDERFSDIAVVAKTAVDEKTEVTALELGADDYIFSPCDPAIIKKRVHNIAQKYILEKEKIRMQLEEEQRMSQAKELFLARMSHELRTPISGILGISQLAHYKDPKVSGDFKKIRVQAEYLQALVNDVLDMAAIDNDKLKLHNSIFPLNSVVSDVSDLFFSQCRNKKIKFNFRVDNVMYEYLVGDAVRIKQMLINLLSNAFKFTEKGGCIDVGMREEAYKDGWTKLCLTVKDTGCGISKEALERIWKPFEQETNAGNNVYIGSGLGLPITKGIVEQMDGTISVTSKKGAGTKFKIELPMEIGKNRVKEKRKFKSLKAFLINDDEIALNYMISILTRLGIHYDSAIDEKEVMASLKMAYENGESYDICFIYWEISGGLGKKLTEKIRAEFDHDTLKIVASSYNAMDLEDEMRSCGADYILKKPVLQSQVYRLMSDICSIPEAESDDFGDFDFAGRKVLLAEDNAINAEVLTAFLNAVNIEVDHVENGKAAVKMYGAKKDYYYDAILMDINMPLMNGYDATKKIRKSKKADAADIPIIAVTANAFSKDVVKIHEAGMNAQIVKPVERMALYQMLEKYL